MVALRTSSPTVTEEGRMVPQHPNPREPSLSGPAGSSTEKPHFKTCLCVTQLRAHSVKTAQLPRKSVKNNQWHQGLNHPGCDTLLWQIVSCLKLGYELASKRQVRKHKRQSREWDRLPIRDFEKLQLVWGSRWPHTCPEKTQEGPNLSPNRFGSSVQVGSKG